MALFGCTVKVLFITDSAASDLSPADSTVQCGVPRVTPYVPDIDKMATPVHPTTNEEGTLVRHGQVCSMPGQPLDLTRNNGSGGRAVERRTLNRGDGGSIPPTAGSKLRQFRLLHICLCLSEETLKAGGPFYLVSVPGEVKDPTQAVNV